MSLLPLKNPAACPAPPADKEGTAQSAVIGDWWAFAKEVTCSKGKSGSVREGEGGLSRESHPASKNGARRAGGIFRIYVIGQPSPVPFAFSRLDVFYIHDSVSTDTINNEARAVQPPRRTGIPHVVLSDRLWVCHPTSPSFLCQYLVFVSFLACSC